ncbi:MAG: formate hydrogenlyase [Hydrogenophilales bacterium 28-61-23]|nr:MAG: formate hydrogenlyase [Hydrogenophilales bacterium 28-61-23]
MATHLILKKIFQTGMVSEAPPEADPALRTREQELHAEILKVFGQAIAIRHVDAGSCNGCELEIHAINGPHYNIEGMGIKFAASPRHVDVLLVTGPVSRNLETALKRTYDATPEPKWVVAMGDCASGCGVGGALYGENYATCGKISSVIPVDVEIPGCPPDPVTLLKGILAAVSGDRK